MRRRRGLTLHARFEPGRRALPADPGARLRDFPAAPSDPAAARPADYGRHEWAVRRQPAALELLADPYVSDSPEVEALVRITDAKLRLLEVPVHMRQREHGVSSFRGRRAVKLVVGIGLTLFAGELLRRRYRRG